tara:strand:+ start:542 stop:2257 length:1716 start_codon:yes stop_codon:yes gene_type:complete
VNSSEELSESALLDQEHREALQNVKDRAAFLASSESEHQQQFYLLRLYTQDINCPLRDKEIQGLLIEARNNLSGAARPRMKGERMDTTPTPWVWQGIVMAGTTNLLVAPPKVGKSALMIGMVAAWWHGRGSYLGHKLHGECPPVFIVGTDQPENDWFTLLKREGLVSSDGGLKDPIEMLWHTGSPLHLNEKGIAELEQIANDNPGALFILDSYHACVSPLGIDEATSAFDGPARALGSALAPSQATLVMIHHTNKSVAGGNATNASRGSNALPAAASLTILMNWLRQPTEGQTQTDYRVVLKTQGRAKGTTMVAELLDDGWITHGDGEQAMAQEARAEAELELTGRQADVFDYVNDRWDVGEFPVTANEICAQFSLERNKANRTLGQLVKKALIVRCGEAESTLDGGRPASLYRPNIPLPENPMKNVPNVTNPSRAYEISSLSPFSRYIHVSEGGGYVTPTPGTPVERLVNDKWESGWLIQDGKNPHAITITQLGNTKLRIRNMRLDVDLRFCSSPFPKNDTTDVEPDRGTPVLSIDSPLPNEGDMDGIQRDSSGRPEIRYCEERDGENPI